jgi:hypothetical protein
MNLWAIVYRDRFGKQYAAGPYEENYILAHAQDIKGYEGINDLQIRPYDKELFEVNGIILI